MKKIWIYSIFLTFFSVAVTLVFLYMNYLADEKKVVTVIRKNVLHQVFASGKVESVSEVDLFFKNSGKVSNVTVKVGDTVAAGDVIASQDSKDIDAIDVELAAAVSLQKARIEQLRAGLSKEEIDQASISLTNASTSLMSATVLLDNQKKEVLASLLSAYTVADDSIHNKIDQLFIGPTQQTPRLSFTAASDFTLGNDVELERKNIEIILLAWQDRKKNFSESTDFTKELSSSKESLAEIKDFVTKIAVLVNNSANKPSQVSDEYWSSLRENVSLSRANLDAVILRLSSSESSLTQAVSQVKTSKGLVNTAESTVMLKKAKTRSTDLAVYYAELNQAIAAKEKNDALRKDLQIVAPLSGIVTSLDLKQGEIASPQKKMASILSSNDLEIKLNVVENNIVKVKVGQKAIILFDAVPERKYEGVVTFIDPAETEINGTVYYKVTIGMNTKEDFVRSGMTSSVWINAKDYMNVLTLPFAALYKENGHTYVYARDRYSKKIVKKLIVTGVEGVDGSVVVLSGVDEGDVIFLEPHS